MAVGFFDEHGGAGLEFVEGPSGAVRGDNNVVAGVDGLDDFFKGLFASKVYGAANGLYIEVFKKRGDPCTDCTCTDEGVEFTFWTESSPVGCGKEVVVPEDKCSGLFAGLSDAFYFFFGVLHFEGCPP